MEETKKKVDKIKDTKDRLVDALNGEIAKGVEKVDAEEAGAITDMIKDLAEAEKECWEACYYKSIVEAMDESKEGERMGYDRYRYANGEFAPKPTRGYTPIYANDGNFYDDLSDHMMGYTPDGTKTNTRMGNRMGYDKKDPVDELAELWSEADHDTKIRMKSALEEMVQQIGA